MIEINKKAGFWIRLTALAIDALIFSLIGILSSLMCIKSQFFTQINSNLYQVKNDWTYFVWLFLLIIFLVIQFIIIPFALNGRTIGMLITKIKIDFKNQDKKRVILKRIQIGALLWIFIIITFICFVWPETINKMIIYNYIKRNFNNLNEEVNKLLNENQWSILETAFYSIPSVFSSITVLMQLFFLISTGFKGNKEGLVDKFTNSQVIYSNKFAKIDKETIIVAKPEKNIEYEIVWKE